MKKVIAALLCLVICVGVVGCSSSEPKAENTEQTTSKTSTGSPTQEETTVEPSDVEDFYRPRTFNDMTFEANSAYTYEEDEQSLIITINGDEEIQIIALSYDNEDKDFEDNYLSLPIEGFVGTFEDIQARTDNDTSINGRPAKTSNFTGKQNNDLMFCSIVSIIGGEYQYGISYTCSSDALDGNNIEEFNNLVESATFGWCPLF